MDQHVSAYLGTSGKYDIPLHLCRGRGGNALKAYTYLLYMLLSTPMTQAMSTCTSCTPKHHAWEAFPFVRTVVGRNENLLIFWWCTTHTNTGTCGHLCVTTNNALYSTVQYVEARLVQVQKPSWSFHLQEAWQEGLLSWFHGEHKTKSYIPLWTIYIIFWAT